MIKPGFIKILTYPNANSGMSTMWYVQPGNGGAPLNAKHRQLIPSISSLVSDSTIGGFSRSNKKIELISKTTWRWYR